MALNSIKAVSSMSIFLVMYWPCLHHCEPCRLWRFLMEARWRSVDKELGEHSECFQLIENNFSMYRRLARLSCFFYSP